MSDLISVPPPDFATGTVSASGSAFGCAADTRSYDADAPSARPAVWTMEAIAHVRSDFPGKFGVPRQSGLVEALEARVVFMPSYRNRDALRGVEGTAQDAAEQAELALKALEKLPWETGFFAELARSTVTRKM